MNRRIVFPILVVVLGVLGFGALLKGRRTPQREDRTVVPPLVRVEEVVLQSARLDVSSQGEVRPETESDLVAQVAGQILEVSPSLVPGGFVQKNDVLAVVDPSDYELAVTRAEAGVAQAKVRLALEQGEAEVARRDWESLGGGEADPLVLREPQLAQARAALESARASLEKARLDLSRTRIRSPFDGRVRLQGVDVGQSVSAGALIARVYSTDAAEVRLAIPTDHIGFLDLPLGYASSEKRFQPSVTLRSKFAGRWHEWKGKIVRTEGAIDPETRMMYVVARVMDPYGRRSASGRGANSDGARNLNLAPLTVGLFVDAVIEGKELADVAVLPRSALREGERVLVVDEEERLHSRDVEIVRFDGERVLIGRGLEAGELVCISPIEIAVDGMKVRVTRMSPGAPL